MEDQPSRLGDHGRYSTKFVLPPEVFSLQRYEQLRFAFAAPTACRMMNNKHILVAQWLALSAFAAAVLSTRRSGVFLFDNLFLYDNIDSFGLAWCRRIESVYEWALSIMLITGIYAFLTQFRNGISKNISLLSMAKLTSMAAFASVLLSFELQAINRQQRIVEEFGGSFDFVHHAFFIHGTWYTRLVAILGIPCSILGWICVASSFFKSIRTAKRTETVE